MNTFYFYNYHQVMMENNYNKELATLLKDLTPTVWWKRLLTFVIDRVVLYGIFFFWGALAGATGFGLDLLYEIADNRLLDILVTTLVYVAYCGVLEYGSGKTIGKILMKTRVVREDGSKPDFITIVKRSLSRIIPFDAFSFLSNNPRGWHDSISDTIVVDEAILNSYSKVLLQKNEEDEEDTF
jgi:uncharacterized RDD family membrane protein YckC